MAADYRVHLANPAAIQQYSGLKYTDDHSDARWLAHLLRLGVLPEGYIYPKAERAVRDLLRKRAHLVRQHTANVLSVQNIMARNTGARFSVKRIQELTKQELTTLLAEETQVLAVTSSLVVLDCLRHQIKTLEQTVHKRLHHTPSYEQLLTVQGIGTILAQTITVGNRRVQPLSHRGELCLVLPRCGQHEDQQWQAQRHGQCQKWSPVFGVGLYGGSAVCHAFSARSPALLPTQAGAEP
jgi:transposase